MIKGARRVKDLIRNKAKGNSSKSQALLRHYTMERFLERLAHSPYRDNFVLKGGMLMSSLVGVDQRSTMDIDATVKGLALDTGNALKVVGEIAAVELDDGMEFQVGGAGEIMEDSEYGGVRIALTARMEKTRIPRRSTSRRGTRSPRSRSCTGTASCSRTATSAYGRTRWRPCSRRRSRPHSRGGSSTRG